MVTKVHNIVSSPASKCEELFDITLSVYQTWAKLGHSLPFWNQSIQIELTKGSVITNNYLGRDYSCTDLFVLL